MILDCWVLNFWIFGVLEFAAVWVFLSCAFGLGLRICCLGVVFWMLIWFVWFVLYLLVCYFVDYVGYCDVGLACCLIDMFDRIIVLYCLLVSFCVSVCFEYLRCLEYFVAYLPVYFCRVVICSRTSCV